MNNDKKSILKIKYLIKILNILYIYLHVVWSLMNQCYFIIVLVIAFICTFLVSILFFFAYYYLGFIYFHFSFCLFNFITYQLVILVLQTKLKVKINISKFWSFPLNMNI